MRHYTSPLAAMASKYRIAVVMVTHLSKGSKEKAVYRSMVLWPSQLLPEPCGMWRKIMTIQTVDFPADEDECLRGVDRTGLPPRRRSRLLGGRISHHVRR